MSNLTDFFPSGGGGGSTPSNSVVLIGSDTDSTQIFSPQSNGLEIGNKIFVTLVQGGQGGKLRFIGGMPTTWDNTGGNDLCHSLAGFFDIVKTCHDNSGERGLGGKAQGHFGDNA